MTRWLPSPLLSLALLVIWLLLNQSISAGQILLGCILAVAAPLLSNPLRPFQANVRQPLTFIRLMSWSMLEIVRSCFNVSRIIVFTRNTPNAQFIRVPLDLKDPNGLAMLSCLINCTPGTVWVEIIPDSHELSLHVFDLNDAEWWVNTIKTRYEQPLIDIFERR